MRAILLESNPDFVLALPGIFEALDIPLTVVGTVDAVRRTTRWATIDDFIIVDCSLDRSEDWARCIEVVRQTTLDVHIVYDPAAPADTLDRAAITQAAQGTLKWLPATVGMIAFLTLLRGLRDQSLQARALTPQRPLTDHQRRVWVLVAEGRSHAEIARTLGNSSGAIKRDITRIKEKLGVATTAQLKIAYRWATARRDPGRGPL
jgi:DNA-binding CsgD family transcriptional regulator